VDWDYLGAVAIVVGIPVVALALVFGGVALARDAVKREPVAGAVGVAGMILAVANLLMAQQCDGVTNRPIIAIATEAACRRDALLAMQLVVLVAVATAVVVRLGDVRR
jgi:hypothetical protein